jgi:mono/diheme cytochrome c family protein
LVAIIALGAMGSFEFVREAIRKPYVIGNYLYGNSLYAAAMPGDGGFTVEKINDAGVLKTAKWVEQRELTKDNQVAIGREIFRLECTSCHTTDAYRGVRKYLALRQWDLNTTQAMLPSLDQFHNGVMPPFAGTDAEREALATYLYALEPQAARGPGAANGQTVFEHNCAMCHQARPDDSLFIALPSDPLAAGNALKDLPGLYIRMPNLRLSDSERAALLQWVNTQRSAGGPIPATGGK